MVAGAGGDSQGLLIACVFAGHSQWEGNILPKWALKEDLAFSSHASGCNPSISQQAVPYIRQGGKSSFSSCFLRGTHRTGGNSSFLGLGP